MDAATLQRIVPGLDAHRAAELLPGYDWCCRVAHVNTVRRAAMLLAQVAEESASFRATEEYASGSEYEHREDLGNTQPGDGVRFKGRSLIQITGRNNYGAVSRWAHLHGLVPTATHFLDHPEELAQLRFAWVGPAQYWLGDHDHGYRQLNAAADAGDIYTATLMVNGGLNGYDVRRLYYQRALALGDAILPSHLTDLLEEIMALDRNSDDYKHLVEDVANAVWRRVINLSAPAKKAPAASVLSSIHATVHEAVGK